MCLGQSQSSRSDEVKFFIFFDLVGEVLLAFPCWGPVCKAELSTKPQTCQLFKGTGPATTPWGVYVLSL